MNILWCSSIELFDITSTLLRHCSLIAQDIVNENKKQNDHYELIFILNGAGINIILL